MNKYVSRMRSALTLILGLVLAVSVCLTGCGGSKYEQIGQKVDGSVSTLITNGLGSDITSLKVRVNGTEKWGEELLAEQQTVLAEKTDELNMLLEKQGATYDLLLGLAKGEDVEIHGIDFATMKDITLKYEDGVGFVTYKDADGNEVSTKDAALAEKKAAEEKAKAEAEAKKKAEEEAKKKAEEQKAAEEEAVETQSEETYYEEPAAEEYYEETSSEETYYEEPSYEEPAYEEPSYEEPAPAQTNDDCTADTITLDNL